MVKLSSASRSYSGRKNDEDFYRQRTHQTADALRNATNFLLEDGPRVLPFMQPANIALKAFQERDTLQDAFGKTPLGRAGTVARHGGGHLLGKLRDAMMRLRSNPEYQGGESRQPMTAPEPRASFPAVTPSPTGQYGGQPQLDQFGRSLSDYMSNPLVANLLAELDQSYQSREDDLRRRAEFADTNINNIYTALGQALRDADSNYQQINQDAIAQTRENTQNAHAGINNQSAADILAGAQETLGAPSDVTGAMLANVTGAGNDVISQRGQAASQFLTNKSNIDRTYGQKIADASGFQGANMRASLQNDLMTMLNDLAHQRAMAMSQGRMAQFDMARALYDADYGQWADRIARGDRLDSEAFNRAMSGEELELRRQQILSQLGPQGYEPTAAYEKAAIRMQQQGLDSDSISLIMDALNRATYSATGDPVRYAMDVERKLVEAGADPRLIAIARQEAMEYLKEYR